MLYVDYNWDLSPNTIIPDPDLNTDQLNWKPGDLFQVQEVNGKKILCRIDPMVKFVVDGVENGHS